jgi:hypothetical protein
MDALVDAGATPLPPVLHEERMGIPEHGGRQALHIAALGVLDAEPLTLGISRFKKLLTVSIFSTVDGKKTTRTAITESVPRANIATLSKTKRLVISFL